MSLADDVQLFVAIVIGNGIIELGKWAWRKRRHDPDQAYYWSQEWQAGEREAEADIEAGRVTRYPGVAAFMADLEREDDERDAEFVAGNDAIWGPGNWIKCYECPSDSHGDPVYHHKNAHTR